LRKKLGSPVIETVRGLGYRMAEPQPGAKPVE
jgi:DNA-binding response OmpR family regulator